MTSGVRLDREIADGSVAVFVCASEPPEFGRSQSLGHELVVQPGQVCTAAKVVEHSL